MKKPKKAPSGVIYPHSKKGKRRRSISYPVPLPMGGGGVNIDLGVAWDDAARTKQTLFAMYGNGLEPLDDVRAKKGKPPSGFEDYCIRVTKGVNMNPGFRLLVTKNGDLWTEKEMVKISVVSAIDQSPPPMGVCVGEFHPVISEGKLCPDQTNPHFLDISFKGGVLMLNKLQIGCLSGTRGHGVPFQLKIEFVREDSELFGKVVFSKPLHVGAKGPFAIRSKAKPKDSQMCIDESSSLDIDNGSPEISNGEEIFTNEEEMMMKGEEKDEVMEDGGPVDSFPIETKKGEEPPIVYKNDNSYNTFSQPDITELFQGRVVNLFEKECSEDQFVRMIEYDLEQMGMAKADEKQVLDEILGILPEWKYWYSVAKASL